MFDKTRFKILLLLVFFFIPTGCASPPGGGYYAAVARVVDGDTIKLTNGEYVRYIGIDTPELHHPRLPVQYFSEEARDFNQSLVGGKRVRLEFDVVKRDKYDRILAYVYVDDTFVNARLVEEGYAHIMTIPPNVKYAEEFLRLQQKARQEKKGLWAE
jgi:micrococcal nuclease